MECSDGCSQGSSRHSSVTPTTQLRVDLDFASPPSPGAAPSQRERGDEGAMGRCPMYGSSKIWFLLHPHSWDSQAMGTAGYPRPWGRCFWGCDLLPVHCSTAHVCLWRNQENIVHNPMAQPTSRGNVLHYGAAWSAVAGPLDGTVSHTPKLSWQVISILLCILPTFHIGQGEAGLQVSSSYCTSCVAFRTAFL